MLLPGIKINTSPTDFYPIEQMQMMQLQRRALGAVRPGDERRSRELNPVRVPGAVQHAFMMRRRPGTT